MLDDVNVFANGKLVLTLRGGRVISAAPGYTAQVVRRGMGPGRGLHRGWGQTPPGQLKGEDLFGMGATINTLPLYANLDEEATPDQRTFAEDDATKFNGLDEFGDDEKSANEDADSGVF